MQNVNVACILSGVSRRNAAFGTVERMKHAIPNSALSLVLMHQGLGMR